MVPGRLLPEATAADSSDSTADDSKLKLKLAEVWAEEGAPAGLGTTLRYGGESVTLLVAGATR